MNEGWLVREGAGRGTRYRAARGAPGFGRTYDSAGLDESDVTSDVMTWLAEQGFVRTVEADVILEFAVSELVNNAIDHSGADTVEIRIDVEGDELRVVIIDSGVGAFENLRSKLNLDDHLHALQELSKGKVTTQPKAHSGEGLFFTSKLVGQFRLTANGIAWIVDNELDDQTIERAQPKPGTQVELELSAGTRLAMKDVFERYTHDFEFDTTCCVIRLFEYGTKFISRSEAKRLVRDLERFREVVLDFRGVTRVGQGFVDQVFRVWARQHPGVKLVPEGMNPDVEFMVKRGIPGVGGAARGGSS